MYLLTFAMAIAQPAAPPASTVRWVRGSSNSESLYKDGALVEVLREGGIEIRATLADTGAKMRVNILVVNNSPARIDVVPDQFALEITEPKLQVLKYQDPGQMAKSMARRAGWAGFGAGLGGMSTKTVSSESQTNGNVSIHDQDGNSSNGTYSGSTTTTTTVPDEQARERSRERVAEIHERTRESIAELNSMALRANTLEPGMQVEGAVFFSREKKHDRAVLTVPIGPRSYEFAFRWPKK